MTTDSTHALTQVPIGITATGTRTEFDSMGNVDVPADRYGGRTQRSLQRFSIGNDHMSIEVYRAYGYVKKACALVNETAGRLPGWKAAAITQAADETIDGKLDTEFPLFVWQTGSGTQSNTNVNEGALQPRYSAARRGTRLAAAGQTERRRQHGAVPSAPGDWGLGTGERSCQS